MLAVRGSFCCPRAGFDLGWEGIPLLKHRLPGSRAGASSVALGSRAPELRVTTATWPWRQGWCSLGEAVQVGGAAKAFRIWPVLLSLGARGVRQHELSFPRPSGRRDCFLMNEVSGY